MTSSSRTIVLARATLGDFVDGLLRAVDDLVDVTTHAGGCTVAKLHDARAGLDEAAQDGALAHDLGVVTRVRCRRNGRNQGVEVRRASDLGEYVAVRVSSAAIVTGSAGSPRP